MLKSKGHSLSDWLPQWVTRSPIELFWTAKKDWKMCFIENWPAGEAASVSAVPQVILQQPPTCPAHQVSCCQSLKKMQRTLKVFLFFIPFLCTGFTRGRSRTSVRTASAVLSSCHMSSNTQGFIQVANQTTFTINSIFYVLHMGLASLPELAFLLTWKRFKWTPQNAEQPGNRS